jgi:ubiquitin-activating enzyme E1 C
MNLERDVSISFESILKYPGPFTDPDYEYEIGKTELDNANVLVIGAGGLGCEILKDLSLSGIKKISVIDMDTIELTNLNRQFLFRQENVGQSKAIVATNSILSRIKGIEIKPYFKKIQDFDTEFYKQFTIVVCGLDSIEARRWINQKLVDIATHYNHIIPMIDGGTEGFQGSVKLIIPSVTACFECYMPLIPEKITYPLCTLASTPRLAEHCIEWAHQLEWSKIYKDLNFDPDKSDHIDKMYKLAKLRADEFGIEGVTKSKTLGVVKNIIPAIASTNAIISAQCCNEVFKFLTTCNPNMKDMMFYNGEMGVLCDSHEYNTMPECPVCGNSIKELTLSQLEYDNMTMEKLVFLIKDRYKLDQPVLLLREKELYNSKFTDNELRDKFIADFIADCIVTIIDKNVSNKLLLRIVSSQK